MRKCKICSKVQTLDSFHRDPRGKDGRKNKCKTCVSSHFKARYLIHGNILRQRGKAWQEANPDKVFAKHIRLTYSLSFEEYIRMMGEQNGLCAICHKLNMSLSGKQKRLVVDHRHSDGQVRGLLCDSCNHMLGFAQDCPETLLAGITYLNFLL